MVRALQDSVAHVVCDDLLDLEISTWTAQKGDSKDQSYMDSTPKEIITGNKFTRESD